MPRGQNCNCNREPCGSRCCNPSPVNVNYYSNCPYRACVLVCHPNGRPACGYRVVISNRCLGIRLSGVTNCTGRINFNCLPAGRYICTLVGKNDSCRSEKSISIRFELNCCNPCQNICLTTASVRCSGRITIKLVDEETCKPLEGGKFRLETEGGEFVGLRKTNSKGITTFTNLPMGDYVLSQTKAPHGYKKQHGEIDISLTKDKKCACITVKNRKKHCGCICLCLTECRTKKPICGAKFALYDKCHKKLDCKTTNRKGCLKVPGKYYINQLTTRPGYSKIHKPICVHLTHHHKCEKVKVCNRKKHCKEPREDD